MGYDIIHTVVMGDWWVWEKRLLHTHICLRIHCSIHGELAGGSTCVLIKMYFETKSIVRTQSKEEWDILLPHLVEGKLRLMIKSRLCV
jgi:hypothetical protein